VNDVVAGLLLWVSVTIIAALGMAGLVQVIGWMADHP
jgi:hypothetical protein